MWVPFGVVCGRTLHGIDEQIAKAEKAVAGTMHVKVLSQATQLKAPWLSLLPPAPLRGVGLRRGPAGERCGDRAPYGRSRPQRVAGGYRHERRARFKSINAELALPFTSSGSLPWGLP
jgi:hypothetical protein